MIKERTKTVELRFEREELLYDIRNIAYVEGDVMKGEEHEHNRHQVQDIGEDGNIDRVTRVLDLWVDYCREKLFPVTKEDVESGLVLEDDLVETDVYVINMLVPDDFSSTTCKYLERLIHEFLVDRVLADWFGIVYPDKAAWWLTKAGEIEDQIDSQLNKRTGRVRKFQSSF